jgi:hypothetical protein
MIINYITQQGDLIARNKAGHNHYASLFPHVTFSFGPDGIPRLPPARE